jgi:hypothetical protein
MKRSILAIAVLLLVTVLMCKKEEADTSTIAAIEDTGTSTAVEETAATPTDGSWIKVEGRAEPLPTGAYRVSASGGVLEVQSADVRVTEGSVMVRKGAKVTRVSLSPAARPSSSGVQGSTAGCSGNTYCVGLAEFCCSNDELIGACIGAWDCS